jgi:hypothetical protein
MQSEVTSEYQFVPMSYKYSYEKYKRQQLNKKIRTHNDLQRIREI